MSQEYRPAPPPSTNGWGNTIDREVRAIHREMDARIGLIKDHEDRLRSLEHSSQDHTHWIEVMWGSTEDTEARLATVERALRIIVWVLAAVSWRIAPDLASYILALLPVRI